MGELEADGICMLCMITMTVRIKRIQMIVLAGWLGSWNAPSRLVETSSGPVLKNLWKNLWSICLHGPNWRILGWLAGWLAYRLAELVEKALEFVSKPVEAFLKHSWTTQELWVWHGLQQHLLHENEYMELHDWWKCWKKQSNLWHEGLQNCEFGEGWSNIMEWRLMHEITWWMQLLKKLKNA